MANNLMFEDAEKARDSITKQQMRKIKNLYLNWAKEIEEQAKKYKGSQNQSAAIQEKQMKELKKMLKKSANNLNTQIQNEIKWSIKKICESVIVSNNKWLKSLGFDVPDAAFSNVPDLIIQNLITGKIYKSGWSLSKSIWGDNESTLSSIYEIIAGGLAENESVYEISKKIESFVNPNRAKQWNLKDKDGRMIYPKSVDYNAQRLVRTLSQHGYQQSFIAVTKDNPLITKYKWHSVGHRVCEICKKRDGKIYDKDKLPLDHPNGFCIMEPVVSKTANKDLADWVKGKKNPELDKFAKKLGYKVSSGTKSKAADSKQETKVESKNKNISSKSKTDIKNKNSYSVEELKKKSRKEIENIAKEVYKEKTAKEMGLSESEAEKRFGLLIGANTTSQLINYIRKNKKK